MRRECGERFPLDRLQRRPLVSGPGMHLGTCVTHVPWCLSGSLTRGGGENVPGIPGACATRNFTYLQRGPWSSLGTTGSSYLEYMNITLHMFLILLSLLLVLHRSIYLHLFGYFGCICICYSWIVFCRSGCYVPSFTNYCWNRFVPWNWLLSLRSPSLRISSSGPAVPSHKTAFHFDFFYSRIYILLKFQHTSLSWNDAQKMHWSSGDNKVNYFIQPNSFYAQFISKNIKKPLYFLGALFSVSGMATDVRNHQPCYWSTSYWIFWPEHQKGKIDLYV